jgi:predicted nucleotidyltransferase
MQKDIYEKIISFLLGASIAIILFGAIVTFKIFIHLSLILAIFATLLYIIVTLFLVLTLDAFQVNKERLKEAKKQTELLEKIYNQNN